MERRKIFPYTFTILLILLITPVPSIHAQNPEIIFVNKFPQTASSIVACREWIKKYHPELEPYLHFPVNMRAQGENYTNFLNQLFPYMKDFIGTPPRYRGEVQVVFESIGTYWLVGGAYTIRSAEKNIVLHNYELFLDHQQTVLHEAVHSYFYDTTLWSQQNFWTGLWVDEASAEYVSLNLLRETNQFEKAIRCDLFFQDDEVQVKCGINPEEEHFKLAYQMFRNPNSYYKKASGETINVDYNSQYWFETYPKHYLHNFYYKGAALDIYSVGYTLLYYIDKKYGRGILQTFWKLILEAPPQKTIYEIYEELRQEKGFDIYQAFDELRNLALSSSNWKEMLSKIDPERGEALSALDLLKERSNKLNLNWVSSAVSSVENLYLNGKWSECLSEAEKTLNKWHSVDSKSLGNLKPQPTIIIGVNSPNKKQALDFANKIKGTVKYTDKPEPNSYVIGNPSNNPATAKLNKIFNITLTSDTIKIGEFRGSINPSQVGKRDYGIIAFTAQVKSDSPSILIEGITKQGTDAALQYLRNNFWKLAQNPKPAQYLVVEWEDVDGDDEVSSNDQLTEVYTYPETAVPVSSPSPTPSPTPTLTPSPSVPSPSPPSFPTPTSTPTYQSPKPSFTASPSPSPYEAPSFTLILIVGVVAVIIAVYLLRKRGFKPQTPISSTYPPPAQKKAAGLLSLLQCTC